MIWKDHWGYLCDGSYSANDAACIVGEFGAKSDWTWMNTLVDYLITINSRNSYFWCLNPNWGDTGGLLKDDWTSEESGKLAILARLQPSPTSISTTNTQVCTSTPPPTPYPSTSPSTSPPTIPPSTSTSTSSAGGSITIKQHPACSQWWCAVTVDDSSAILLPQISKLEFRDDNHAPWVLCDKTSLGFTIPLGSSPFSGPQDYKATTTSAGVYTRLNAFPSPNNGGSTAQLTSTSTAYAGPISLVDDGSKDALNFGKINMYLLFGSIGFIILLAINLSICCYRFCFNGKTGRYILYDKHVVVDHDETETEKEDDINAELIA